MLVNEANLVKDMLVERLREAQLEGALRPENSQCLDMDNTVFLEVVLSDGAELERVEGIVAELKEFFCVRGTVVDSIVRAVWEVIDVKSRGPAYGKDGALRTSEEFHATLKSGNRVHPVVVEIAYGATVAVRYRLDRQAATGKAAAKITKRVAFHTFRHTYTTLLTQNNEDVKVVQELLRHANSRVTLDLYAQAGMAGKREAQRKVVELVLKKGKAVA